MSSFQQLAAILYKNSVRGLIKATKIEEILKVPRHIALPETEQASAAEADSATNGHQDAAQISGDNSHKDKVKLTDHLIESLSDQFSTEDQLRKFAVIGLGVSKTVFSREMENNPRNIRRAVYKVLEHWWNCFQEDDYKAYDAVCDGLKKAELFQILKEWLKEWQNNHSADTSHMDQSK